MFSRGSTVYCRSDSVYHSCVPQTSVPYVQAYGNITRALQAIQAASTPDRFTQDFLATKLGLKGGGAKAVLPFLKRTGFLGPDGSPTELYRRFRNSASRGSAGADAVRRGFAPLYEVNEYAHDLNDGDLRGLIVQVTGSDDSSSVVRAILGSFKALRDFADFDAPSTAAVDTPEEVIDESRAPSERHLPASCVWDTRSIFISQRPRT